MVNVKISYISHCCLLIEIGEIRILTDPWIVGPCWGGNLWLYPPAKIAPEEIHSIDYIYISHAHEDHLQAETLGRISDDVKSNATTIAPDFEKPYFYKSLNANGLTNILFLKHFQKINLSNNLFISMFLNDTGDDDSSILIESEHGNIFLQTDNLMTRDLSANIGSEYKIDIAFIMATRTGIFPGFYDFSPSVLQRLANDKSEKSYEIAFNIIEGLKPNYIVPYASDLCYLGELYYINEFHRKSKKAFLNYVKNKKSNYDIKLMGPGDQLNINNHNVNFELSTNHDFDGKDLALYAYQKRHEIYKYSLKERVYLEKGLKEDLDLFIEKFNFASKKWKGPSFNVTWIIETISFNQIILTQSLPGLMEINESINYTSDLEIVLPAYRLQRLVKGDYKMGMVTLQNGSIYCKRLSDEITKNESYFWEWAILNTRFNVIK